jgi:hypothetical protein
MPPVLDHETHQATIGSERYDACREKVRKEGYYAQDGWEYVWIGGFAVWMPKWVWITDESSATCRYDKSLTDPKCEGCHRRGQGEQYDQQIRSKGK